MDLEARRETYGAIYTWLYRHHGRIAASLRAGTPSLWEFTARAMTRDGVLSKRGLPPTRSSVRNAWLQVVRHSAEDARRRADQAKSDSGHVSRRQKGWVPTSSEPSQPPPAQATSRQNTTIAPHPRAADPAMLTPAAVPTPDTKPLRIVSASAGMHPEAHLLDNMTPEEAEFLAPHANAPVASRLSVLKTFRTMHHKDRFNRPGWK